MRTLVFATLFVKCSGRRSIEVGENFKVENLMKISRGLKIHICFKCTCVLEDHDFTALGIIVRARLQYFFDFTCPRCAHRGRYIVALTTDIGVVQALQFMAKKIIEDGDSHDDRIDWDSIKWE